MTRNISNISFSQKNYPNNLVVSENCVNTHTHTHTHNESRVARVLYEFYLNKEFRDENLELSFLTAICHRLKALGIKSTLAVGSMQKAVCINSKLKPHHSISALGSKQKAVRHSSLNPLHFYLAESLKLKAYSLYTALSLAFLALGCSPVLVSYILCVVFLGAGHFFCALSRKPNAVGKSVDFRNENLEIRYWKALCRRLKALSNHFSLKTHHSNLAAGSKPKAISHSSLKTQTLQYIT